jgi:hypothetical protein
MVRWKWTQIWKRYGNDKWGTTLTIACRVQESPCIQSGQLVPRWLLDWVSPEALTWISTLFRFNGLFYRIFANIRLARYANRTESFIRMKGRSSWCFKNIWTKGDKMKRQEVHGNIYLTAHGFLVHERINKHLLILDWCGMSERKHVQFWLRLWN